MSFRLLFRALAALALLLGAGPPPVPAAPRVGGDVPPYAFGAVERGTRVEHTFTVPNRGDATLVLDHVKTTCDCTVAVVSAREVPPGGEARVAVSLDTARLAGPTTKVVTVHTNDPERPTVPLALAGQVLADLVLDPRSVYVGRVRRGESLRREVLIAPGRPGGSVVVTAVEHASRALRARIEPRTDGPGQRLVVEVEPGAAPGRFHEELVLRTTSSREPTLIVPVFGSVEGDVVVLPPQVTFGVTRASARPERELFIRNRGSRPVSVTRVDAPAAVVSWELTTVRPGVEYRLALRLRPDVRAGKIEDAIEIFTNHPDERKLVVPLYAIVRRG